MISYVRITTYFVILSSTLASYSTSPTISEQLHMLVLGSHDASHKQQLDIRSALNRAGIEHADLVPVKQMNDVGPYLAGSRLVSFTADGIWLNEQALADLSPEEQAFVYQHEAVHYLRNHHAELLIHLTSVSYIATLIIATSRTLFSSTLLRTANNLILGYLAATLYIKHILQPLRIRQEHEADYTATRILVNSGNSTIVHHYLAQLDDLIADGMGTETDGWHETLLQQRATIATALAASTVHIKQ